MPSEASDKQAWEPTWRADGSFEISVRYYHENGRIVSGGVEPLRYLAMLEDENLLVWQRDKLPQPEHNPSKERVFELLEALEKDRPPLPVARLPSVGFVRAAEDSELSAVIGSSSARTNKPEKIAMLTEACRLLGGKPHSGESLAEKAADLFFEKGLSVNSATLYSFISTELTNQQRMQLGLKAKIRRNAKHRP